MIKIKELDNMTHARKQAFFKSIIECADRWFAEDPSREAAYQAWLIEYRKRIEK